MEEPSKPKGLSLRRIFGLSSIYGITPILDRAMGLLLLPIYTHYLDTSQYGSMVLFYTFAFIVRLAAFMGFPDSLQKMVWDYKEEDLKRFLGSIWLFNLVVNLMLLSALMIFSRPISIFLLKNGSLSFLLILVIANVFLATQSIIPYVLFRAREMRGHILAYNLTSVLVRVGATVLFLIILKMGLVGIFLADIAASLGVLIFCLQAVFKSIEINFNIKYIKSIFQLSGFQLIIELLAWVLSLSDRVLIQKLLNSTAEVGIYAVGYTFGSAVMFITKPIQAAWVPYVYLLHNKSKQEYTKQMSYFFNFFFFSCVLACCVLFIISPNVIILLTPKVYHDSINLLLLVLLGHLCAMLANYFTATFYLYNRLSYVAQVYLITACINIGINFLLIPSIGIYAAALSTFLSYFIMAILLFNKSQEIKKIEINYYFLTKVTMISLLMTLAIRKINVVSNVFTLLLKTTSVCIILLLLFLLRKVIYQEVKA